jgi:hypothetical protein
VQNGVTQLVSNQNSLQHTVQVDVNDNIGNPGLVEKKAFQLPLKVNPPDNDAKTVTKLVDITGSILTHKLIDNADYVFSC